MTNSAFKTYANEHGGRVLLLFLLFLLAIYQFIHAGFAAFAIICLLPAVVLIAIAGFHYRMLCFWALIIINYFLQMKDFPSTGIPMSMYNEMFEIILIALAIIDVQNAKFGRTANLMLFAILLWCSFCTLEVLNDTCDIGINVGAWFTGARMMAFQMIYIFLVFSLYIDCP